MLLVDDLLIRPFVSMLDLLHGLALRELYDAEELRDELKENRLLYEIGERDESTYQREKARIEAELTVAEGIEDRLAGRFEVKR